jgi:predicted DNA-binding protein with PD1-like motif
LESFAFDKKISAALCFFLGGAKEKSRIIVGPKRDKSIPPEPMITLLDGVHEAQGIGTLIKDEQGKSKLHMHTSFGRKKNTITGCIRMGVDVWRIGEVVILELNDVKASRIKDKETGFEFLEIDN